MIEDKKPVKKEESSQKKESQKKKKACFTWKKCCCSCLVLILVMIIAFLIAFALAGFRIPLLYSLLYGNGPNPVREVKVEGVNEEFLNNQMSKVAATGENQILLTEQELSFYVNEMAKGSFQNQEEEKSESGKFVFEGERGQAAIEDDYVELFIKLKNPPSAITIWLETKEFPGQTQLVTKRLRLGKMPILSFLANFFAMPMLNDILFSQMAVESVEIEKGILKIHVDPERLQENLDKEAEEGLKNYDIDPQP